MSICQIEHNGDSSAVEINFQLFTEDLEAALIADGLTRPALGTTEENDSCFTAISNYIQRYFQISINGGSEPLRYIGHESEFDRTWCYLEIGDINSIEQIEVTDRVLMEVFEDQVNIVRVDYQSRQKSLLLQKGAVSGMLQFR